MQNGASYQELSRRYGFAPKPESASRLTQLVARQDSDLDEIARVIDRDDALRKRLLRVANPDAENEAEYAVETVEEALLRQGLGCALVLAMSTPLAQALVKSFQTMLSLKLEDIDRYAAEPLDGEHWLCEIGFSGKVVGQVNLRMSLAAAKAIAAGILGLPPAELTHPDEIKDAAGELLNIMTGNFKSNLCDAGLDCRLQPPQVNRTNDLHTRRVPGGGLEHMA
ncbi:MAG TPA: chemotaxis protein CheX, partial [Verrucomicrobiae bacterium]|nr:chemotaxis protein CheX [Verrucomicrobiae bacterium]